MGRERHIAGERRYSVDGDGDRGGRTRLPVADGVGERVRTHGRPAGRVGIAAVAVGRDHPELRGADGGDG